MKLHIEIENLIETRKNPLTISEITKEINSYHSKNNPTSPTEILTTIRKHHEIFQEINGKVIRISDPKWKEALTSYWYILNVLQRIYNNNELQFIVSALFFYKRISDLPSNIKNKHSTIETSPHNWLASLHALETENIFSVNIFNDLSTLLEKLPDEKIIDIFQIISRVDTKPFNHEEFGTLFEHILDSNTPNSHRHPTARTAQQVCELMANVLDAEHGKIYDPVCGTGSLLTHAVRATKDSIHIKGDEILHSSARLAAMNLYAHGLLESDIQATDCFQHSHDQNQYDYIIGDLPPLSFTYNSISPRPKRFSDLINLVVSKLKHNGKAVLTVQDRFLFSSGEAETCRKELITEDLIECIISLPIGSLKPHTHGKASIIIINKAKPSALINKVKFIHVENLTPNSSTPFIDINSAVNSYKEKYISSRNSQIIDTSEILERRTLNASSYTENRQEIEKLLKDGKARRLGELVNITSGVAPTAPIATSEYEADTPHVKIENLEKDILDMHLSAERINNHISRTKRTEKFFISNECILIARIGDNLKPTIFKPTKRTPEIVAHQGVILLTPKPKSDIDIEYLYYQLYSSVVQAQIEPKRAGTVMPFLNKTVLSDIIIPIMPIKSQREFIATQKQNIIAAEKERVNQRLRAIGLEEKSIQQESDIISTLVHELRPKLIKINTLSNKITRIIEKYELLELTEYSSRDIELDDLLGVVEKPENYNLGYISQKISSSSKELNDTLSLVKDVMSLNLKPNEFTKTNILDFIKEHLLNKKCEPPQKYKIEIKGSDVEAVIHQASIKQVINQLIENAEHHAFPSPNAKDRITFTIREDKERKVASIEYTNNGKPFNLKKSDYIQFLTKSKSSNGSGIGGNYIHRIIKAHNGDIDVEENRSKGFLMTIEIPNKDD